MMTEIEAEAECERIVSEFEMSHSAYDVALFHQLVARHLRPRYSAEQLGGCRIIRPNKFKRKS